MKAKGSLTNCFFTALKIWAAAWLSYLFSIIPIYIWRGTHDVSPEAAMRVENVIFAVCGLVFGFFILTLLFAKTDFAERLGFRDSIFHACGSAGLYTVIWLIYALINQNHILLSVTGYYMSCVFGQKANDHPTLLASFLASIVFGVVYGCALLFGAFLARNRRKKQI